MIKKMVFIALISTVAYGARLGSLSRNSNVTTPTELAAYAVDPATLQAQIDALTAILSGGITTNLNGFTVVDGVIKGTN
jgi:hypothetical protein